MSEVWNIGNSRMDIAEVTGLLCQWDSPTPIVIATLTGSQGGSGYKSNSSSFSPSLALTLRGNSSRRQTCT